MKTKILFCLAFFCYTYMFSQDQNIFQINPNIGSSHKRAIAIKINDKGNMICAWPDYRGGVFGSMNDLFLQRLNWQNGKIGINFQPPSISLGNDNNNPSIAVNKNGDFAVTRSEQGLAILRYDADMNQQGSVFEITDTTFNSSTMYNYPPAIVLRNDNTVMVFWGNLINNSSGRIFGVMLDKNNNLMMNPFVVNDDGGLAYHDFPAAAVDSSGHVVVAWEDERYGQKDIYFQMFNENGSKIGINVRVTTSTTNESNPRVAMRSTGDFVISWLNANGYLSAKFFDKNGNSVGEIPVIDSNYGCSYSNHFPPHEIVYKENGEFWIVWFGGGVALKGYNMLRTVISPTSFLTTEGGVEFGSFTMNNQNEFVVAYRTEDENHNWDEYYQKLTPEGRKIGERIKINDDEGSAPDLHQRHDINEAGDIACVWEVQGQSMVLGKYLDYSGNSLSSVFNPALVNTGGNPSLPEMVLDEQGNSIVVWYGQSSLNIQEFNKNGIEVTEKKIIVNMQNWSSNYSTSMKLDPNIGPIVVWNDNRSGSGIHDIYGLRLNKVFAPIGTEFIINDDIGNNKQENPKLEINSNGYFAVIWMDCRNNGLNSPTDLYGQMYDNLGQKTGVNFKINQESGVNTYGITKYLDSLFVVCWGESSGIWARIFNNNGLPKGNRFLVNNSGIISLSIDANQESCFEVAWSPDARKIQSQKYNRFAQEIGPVNLIYSSNNDLQPVEVKINNEKSVYTWCEAKTPGKSYDVFGKVEPFLLLPTPNQNALSVKKDIDIQAIFGFDMKPTTLTNKTIIIKGSQSGIHSGQITYSSTNRTMTFDPTQDFFVGEKVTCTLTNDIKASDGSNGPGPYTWQFTVEALGGSGKFQSKQDLVGSSSNLWGSCSADFDRDGLVDLMYTDGSAYQFYKNTGNGSFQKQTTQLNGFFRTHAVSDFNNDGKLDFVSVNQPNLTCYINIEKFSFSTKNSTIISGSGNFYLTSGDFNGDGFDDIAVTNLESSKMYIAIGNGDGTFHPGSNYSTSPNPAWVVSGDINNDGHTDIVIATSKQTTPNKASIFMGNGDGTFSSSLEYDIPHSGSGSGLHLALVDVNHDTYLDIAVANRESGNDPVSIFLNVKNGTFLPRQDYVSGGSNPCAISSADFDADGDMDLVVANHYSQNASVLTNNGLGTFSSAKNYSAGTKPNYVETADYDNDGDMDFIVINQDSKTLSLFLNNNSGASIAANVDSLDFGGAYKDSTKSLTVRLSNVGADSLLRITAFTSSNPSFYADPPTANIPVGGFADIGIKFTPNDGIAYSDSITVTSNDRMHKNIVIHVQGYGDPIKSMRPGPNAWQSPTDSTIAVSFHEEMVSSTINAQTVVLHSAMRGVIPWTYQYDSGTKTVVFSPGVSLHPGDRVEVTLTQGIKYRGEYGVEKFIPGSHAWNFGVPSRGGSGKFNTQTLMAPSTGGRGISAGFLDGNATCDIAIPSGSTMIKLFSNDGRAGFTSLAEISESGRFIDIQLADLDNDGDLDLVAGNQALNGISIFFNSGNGVLSDKKDYPSGNGAGGVEALDANNDGYLDIVVVNTTSETVSLFINNKNKTFTKAVDFVGIGTAGGPTEIAAGDLDNDGATDFIITGESTPNALIYHNNRKSTFFDADTIEGGFWNLCLGDYTNDGYLDIAFVASDGVSLYRNLGNIEFQRVRSFETRENSYAISAADLNGDGWMDLAVANRGPYNSVSVLMNKGDGTFLAKQDLDVGSNPHGVVSADFDGDGDLDLAVANLNSSNLSVLTNKNSAPEIAFTPDSLNFDAITIGTLPQSKYLRITNNSAVQTLTVTSITATDTAFFVDPTTATIPAGRFSDIMVDFNPKLIQVFDDSLAIRSNDPNKPVIFVPLKGIGQALPVAVTMGATDTTSNSAIVTGMVNPKGNRTKVSFVYGPADNPSLNMESPADSTGDGMRDVNIRVKLTGLQSNTRYQYRIIATNDVGTTEGGERYFHTLAGKPTAETNMATDVDSTSATLNAIVNPNGFPITVKFAFGTTESYGDTVLAEQSQFNDAKPHPVRVKLTDLLVNTIYHYTVLVFSTVPPVSGKDTTFVTNPASIILHTLSATNVTAHGATLNGEVNPKGVPRKVKFLYGIDPTYGVEKAKSDSVRGDLLVPVNVTLDGLISNTTYHYCVEAASGTDIKRSTDSTFTTEKEPPTVTVASATNVDTASAWLRGVVNPNGLRTVVRFTYGMTQNYGSFSDSMVFDGRDNHAVEIEVRGLKPNTLYHYSIIAKNEKGTASGLDTLFTTKRLPPSIETAVETGSNSAVLVARGNPNGYQIQVHFEWGATSQYGNVTTPIAFREPFELKSKPITGLLINTTYHFKVVVAIEGEIQPLETSDLEFKTNANSPAAVTLEATDRDTSEAVLRGEVNPKGMSVEVFFLYGMTTAYGDTVWAEPSSVNGSEKVSVSSQVTGLLSNTEYHYQLVARNSAGMIGVGLDKSFSTRVDKISPAIMHTAIAGATADQAIDITAVMTDNFGVTERKLYFRSGGSSDYMLVNMSSSGGNQFRGVIPVSAVTIRGVEYYIMASDSTGNTSTNPITDPTHNPHVVRVTNSNLMFSSATPSMSYRMVSVPFDLGKASADSVLRDDLGAYNDTEWRLMRYLNGRYVEYGDTILSEFKPGNGFWLITRQAKTLSAGAGFSVSTAQPYTIILKPGWNQIGNPFAFPVAWADVVKPSNIESQLVGYSGDVNDSTGYDYTRTVLLPWEGYFVNNLDTKEASIEIPSKAASEGATKSDRLLKTPFVLNEGEWVVRLDARCGKAVDRDNFVGCLSESEDGWDERDFSEAPPFQNSISLFFNHPEWERHPGNYTGDFRSLDVQGKSWDLEVRSVFQGRSITISTDGLGELPRDWKAILLDKTGQSKIPLSNNKTYSFLCEDRNKSREFKLIAGLGHYVESNDMGYADIPSEFDVMQNYPNPFNAETRIRYLLPESGNVMVLIFNVAGQKIATLFDGLKSAGRYEAVWNGIDDWGSHAASGVYLIGVYSAKQKMIKKMVMVQ